MTNSVARRFIEFLGLSLIMSCATIVMPSGGPKDSKPPETQKSFPSNNAINFQEDKLIFSFNEFVEWDAPQQKVFISPYTRQKLNFSISGKKAIIHFTEPLKPNTTYVVNLQNALKDFTEGNSAGNISLRFSTGTKIDSGRLRVDVRDAISKTSNDKSLLVLSKTKSDFFGKNYSYIAPVSMGKAEINNLNKETYYAYVFADSNQNYTWDKNEPIGFLNSPIKAGDSGLKIKTFTNKQAKADFIITAKSLYEYDIVSNQDIYFVKPVSEVVAFNTLSAKQLKIILPPSYLDKTIRLNYNIDKYEDIKIPEIKAKSKLEIVESQDRFKTFSPDTFHLDFNAFISRIDTSKIKIMLDGKRIFPQINYKENTLLVIKLDFGKNYTIALDSQAVWSGYQYNTPSQSVWTTYTKDKYFSTITIKPDIAILSQPKYKLFYKQQSKITPIKNNGTFQLNDIYGDDMVFHIVLDENNNGLWDTGDVERGVQPEPFYVETIKLEPKVKEYSLKLSKE